ncbi:hypothetical protein BDR05DRAFT_1061680 [Suillus weaverae]|nr:hypothetical protein BDR05DRAFT_1061680 [Suillus weaverae]
MPSRGAQTRIKPTLSVDKNIDEDLYHQPLILQAVALQLPHLRVDNGMKVWYCTGGPMHVQLLEELYQTLSRPPQLDQAPSFGQAIPATPQPSLSVLVVALPLGLSHPSLQELTDRQVQTDSVAQDQPVSSDHPHHFLRSSAIPKSECAGFPNERCASIVSSLRSVSSIGTV